MDLISNIITEQSYGLNLSNEMQKSLEILQLSCEDLEQYIEDCSIKNPFLFYKKIEPIDNNTIDEEIISNNSSIFDIVENQIMLNITAEKEQEMAFKLLYYLNNHGYLEQDYKEMYNDFSQRELDTVINKLQKFEPLGIFSRSLAEFLKIQLQCYNALDQDVITIIDHIDLLAKKEYKEANKYIFY